MYPHHTAGWAIYSAIADPDAGFWPAIFKAITSQVLARSPEAIRAIPSEDSPYLSQVLAGHYINAGSPTPICVRERGGRMTRVMQHATSG